MAPALGYLSIKFLPGRNTHERYVHIRTFPLYRLWILTLSGDQFRGLTIIPLTWGGVLPGLFGETGCIIRLLLTRCMYAALIKYACSVRAMDVQCTIES